MSATFLRTKASLGWVNVDHVIQIDHTDMATLTNGDRVELDPDWNDSEWGLHISNESDDICSSLDNVASEIQQVHRNM